MCDPISDSPLVDPNTGQRYPQREQPGYYPGYSTLAQRSFWDATTRRIVQGRVEATPPIRFFSEEESRLMIAICDRIVPQDDRLPERQIPIVPIIDERLFLHRIHGYRYEDMPPDEEAYKLGLKAIDHTAQAIHARAFISLNALEQDYILRSIHDRKQLAAKEIWARMSIRRFWEMLVGDCISVYYAHPWAWDEIGFGGPAYPRAYTRLEGGLPEPWEKAEKRYEWIAPIDSISDFYDDDTGLEAQGTQALGETL